MSQGPEGPKVTFPVGYQHEFDTIVKLELDGPVIAIAPIKVEKPAKK